MAWRCGSLSRSFISSARSSAAQFRSSAPSRPPLSAAPRFQSTRRMSFAPARSMGELGCTQSLLPLNSAVGVPQLTSHLSVSVRACCELSHGT
ncbi:hypothetical protein MLD38_013768 [Melastoma candidum]|uniref:Uncharacterized protein n=1 Tax=Melastoma candidum TaxID=119954 RepID=A0ACB9RAL8_9MYRT|nr:hypothetical protein MLD38_013768 [Melastoma candidum]